jgi:predicted GTPase
MINFLRKELKIPYSPIELDFRKSK